MFFGSPELMDLDLSYFGNIVKENINERPMEIKFCSTDQQIKYTIYCYKTDNFSKIEKELYDKFPELKSKNFCFIAFGGVVNRSLTLEQNKIKSDTTILISYLL
jgi:hypothetical protein